MHQNNGNNRDLTDAAIMGEKVLLVRITSDGRTVHEWMPAALAVAELGYNVNNGIHYVRGWILADDYNMGLWDRSV